MCARSFLPTNWRLRGLARRDVAVLYENGIEVDRVRLTESRAPDLHAIFSAATKR